MIQSSPPSDSILSQRIHIGKVIPWSILLLRSFNEKHCVIVDICHVFNCKTAFRSAGKFLKESCVLKYFIQDSDTDTTILLDLSLTSIAHISLKILIT